MRNSGLPVFRNRLRNMARDESGVAAILFALALPALVFIVGMGIDYGRASKERSVASATLDSVLLSVGRELSSGAITEAEAPTRVKTIFNELYAQNAQPTTTVKDIVTTLDTTNGLVHSQVKGDVPAAFGGLLGVSNLEINVNATVNYNILTVELAMVLDITGSMGGTKIADMKAAAKDVISILMPADGSSSDKVRVALSPYSNSVNVGPLASLITGKSSKLCAIERDGIGAFDDTPPTMEMFKFTSSCPDAGIQALTDQRSSLISQIDAYSAGGTTAGHIGIAWGWYMLSPRWNAVLPDGSKASAYGTENLLKVMIVMTDGEFNTQYVKKNGSSASQAENVCDEAKNRDVIIYTVAFQAPSSAQTLLRKCATSKDHYFNASTGTALKEAFQAIAMQIRNLRLSS